MRICDICGETAPADRFVTATMCRKCFRVAVKADARRRMSEAARTHGQSGTATYRVWINVIRRCSNPKDPSYARYGGRGIRICERWRDFANFFADMGERPGSGYDIHRLDSDGNYEPGNCVWIDRAEHGRLHRQAQLSGTTSGTNSPSNGTN